MGNTFFFDWEVRLMEWIQANLGPLGEQLASLVTMLGEDVFLIAIVGFLYWSYDKKMGRFIGLNALTALVLSPMLKNVVLRRRPYFDHPTIKSLRPVTKGADLYDIAAQGFSFPSMHSSDAAAVFGSMAAYLKKRWVTVLAVVMAFLIGLSRICLGVHYPTDVLVGWLIGIVVVLGMGALQRRVKDVRILYAAILLVSFPGLFFCKSEDFFTCYGAALGLIAGFLFDDRFVRFENTRKLLPGILRSACGLALFLVLSQGLKLIVNVIVPGAEGTVSDLLRTARYAVSCFIVIGVYPMCFRPVEAKLFGGKQAEA